LVADDFEIVSAWKVSTKFFHRSNIERVGFLQRKQFSQQNQNLALATTYQAQKMDHEIMDFCQFKRHSKTQHHQQINQISADMCT
jgi:hypothetical protein